MKRIYRLTALVAVIAALLTLACGCSLFEVEPTFSTDLWLEKPHERTAIIDDLLETHELKGMTAQEVVDLLGPHDNIAGYFVQEDRYVYYLGPERGWMSIDSEWLLIDFENGVVVDHAITRD